MLINLLRRLSIIMLLGAAIGMFGCSGGTGLVISENPSNNESIIYNSQHNMGEFTLALDSENITARIEPVFRENALDVTRYVKIKIVGLLWDPVKRIWDIDVTVENPTKYNAYGPWAVFINTGQQKILDQDGFVVFGPYRFPVIAFCKPNPERIFVGQTIEPVHIRIHWPVGWDRFTPMQFLIDVSFPGPRQQPIVEKLQIWQDSPIPEQFNLVGYIKDWQIPPQDPGMEVWVDLTPIGGSDHVNLYDDGAHHDGAPDDDVWGCDFLAVPPPEPIALTVHALDWENYKFENDVIFGPPPSDCLPVKEIESGQWGYNEPMERVIQDPDSWKLFWDAFHPGEEPPVVDFTVDQVIVVMLGWRGSTGYWIRMDCVRELKDTQGNPFTSITYTEMQPGAGCYVLWVIQYPYLIISTPKTSSPFVFDHLLYAYPCP